MAPQCLIDHLFASVATVTAIAIPAALSSIQYARPDIFSSVLLTTIEHHVPKSSEANNDPHRYAPYLVTGVRQLPASLEFFPTLLEAIRSQLIACLTPAHGRGTSAIYPTGNASDIHLTKYCPPGEPTMSFFFAGVTQGALSTEHRA